MYNKLKYFFWTIFMALIGYSFLVEEIAMWVFILLLNAWLVYILVGAFRMRASIFLTSVNNLPHRFKNNILVTFDDGPHPEITPLVLDVLKKYNAQAVFFCIGKNIDLYPEIVKQIVAEGHIVANHSYFHSNFIGVFSTQKVENEICKAEQAIKNCIGRSFKLYRPPFGVTNPNIAQATKKLGMKVVGWNKRSFDTVSKSKEDVLHRVTQNLTNGDIILFHDTNNFIPSILADFLLFASDKGFTFEVDMLVE
jgi:peptidoglycan-N-acetylglucosamine deacetylase